MQLFLFFIVACVLSIVSWEDFKSRTVHAIWFPIVLFLSAGYSYQVIGVDDILANILVSGSFLLLQGILLMGYFAIKHKSWVNITRDYLGWGDILFLFVVLPLFSPLTYMMFYLSSLLLTMSFVLIYKFIINKELMFIPLAGIQSICLLLVLSYHQFVFPVLFHDFLSPLAI